MPKTTKRCLILPPRILINAILFGFKTDKGRITAAFLFPEGL